MLNANNNKNKKLYHSYDDKIRLINSQCSQTLLKLDTLWLFFIWQIISVL